MPYSINRYNGTEITVVEDGTIDNTLDIKLIGKNYAGYGEVQNENFVHLLENFSGTTAPPRPISGQIWFDSSSKKLKFNDGANWRTTGGAEVAATPPAGLTTGDFWFKTSTNQLYAWSGTNYVLVGPQAVAGSGTTQMRSSSVLDTNAVTHAIIEAIVDDETVYIISPTEFTLDSVANPITGFSRIKQGLTLCYTGETGVTSTSHRYWGTASNADKLGGFGIENFLLANAARNYGDDGFTVGDNNDLVVFVENGTDPVIRNAIGGTLSFQTVVSSVVRTPLKLEGNNILPGADGISNIGSTSFKYGTVHANSFNGVASQADSLNVGGSYRNASVSAGINTIAARDGSGNLTAIVFQGQATSARYADLAEKYLADQEYEVGTVIVVGGEKEVTASSQGQRALGVVSSNPAFMMNKDLEGGTYIALKGRVPTKVAGSVKKGDRLTAGDNGCAIATTECKDVFAIALETNNSTEVKLVECVVL